MKKIYFNDQYKMTEKVINREKVQCRITVREQPFFDITHSEGNTVYYNEIGNTISPKQYYFKGEVVSVSQPYKSVLDRNERIKEGDRIIYAAYSKGWGNKKYTDPFVLPYRITIDDVKIERLQDISDEDCIKEGIYFDPDKNGYSYGNSKVPIYDSPREAFISYINKVLQIYKWETNPYVYVYEFTLQ